MIEKGSREGAKVLVDGRGSNGGGYFVRPTVLDGVDPRSALSATEIFGPVLSLVHAETVDEAIEILSRSPYGNAASIFTTSGATARKFRYEAPAGNIGINIGIAAPMAYFPFSGWKDTPAPGLKLMLLGIITTKLSVGVANRWSNARLPE